MRRGVGKACVIAGWIMFVAFVYSLLVVAPAMIVLEFRAGTGAAILVGFFVPPALFVGSLAMIHIGRKLAHRALREGHCRACDYDLRGARHERCPECGTEV